MYVKHMVLLLFLSFWASNYIHVQLNFSTTFLPSMALTWDKIPSSHTLHTWVGEPGNSHTLHTWVGEPGNSYTLHTWVGEPGNKTIQTQALRLTFHSFHTKNHQLIIWCKLTLCNRIGLIILTHPLSLKGEIHYVKRMKHLNWTRTLLLCQLEVDLVVNCQCGNELYS